MDHLDGPECPDCGCQDSRVTARYERMRCKAIVYECKHCGRSFQVIDRNGDKEASGGRLAAGGEYALDNLSDAQAFER
jgi:hypothetical protein